MIERLVMAKRYPIIEEKPQVLEEPAVAYGISTRERVMASTVSVDEYFDELIENVHQDYANL
jgi:hypothetical protein